MAKAQVRTRPRRVSASDPLDSGEAAAAVVADRRRDRGRGGGRHRLLRVPLRGANCRGSRCPDQGNLHIQLETDAHVPYNSNPPTSGPHLPYIAPWGVHTEPISKELQVHNLEDGGVMVQYNCPSGCPDLVEKLKVDRRPLSRACDPGTVSRDEDADRAHRVDAPRRVRRPSTRAASAGSSRRTRGSITTSGRMAP